MAEKADDKKKDDKKEDKKDEKDDKKLKQKEVISKLAEAEGKKAAESAPASPAPTGKRKVTMKVLATTFKEFLSQFAIFDFKILKGKWIFLLVTLILLSFSFIMLSKVGFNFTDLFDFQRISNNIDKIFSISFVLFFLLLSMAFAFAILAGFNMRPSTAFAFTAAVMVVAIIVGFLFDSRYMLAYLWLGLGIVLTALFATMMEDLTFWDVHKTLGKALLVLMIVAVLFSAVKVASDKDTYFDLFVGSVATLTPQLLGPVQNSLGDVVQSVDLSQVDLSDNVSADPAKFTSRTDTDALVAIQYPSFRQAVINSFKNKDDRDYATQNTATSYSSLDISTKQKLGDDTYKALTDKAGSGVISHSLGKGLPLIKDAIAEGVKTKKAVQITSDDIVKIRQKFNDVAFFRQFYEQFWIFVAFLVVSILSIVNQIIRVLASFFCWGVLKLL